MYSECNAEVCIAAEARYCTCPVQLAAAVRLKTDGSRDRGPGTWNSLQQVWRCLARFTSRPSKATSEGVEKKPLSEFQMTPSFLPSFLHCLDQCPSYVLFITFCSSTAPQTPNSSLWSILFISIRANNAKSTAKINRFGINLERLSRLDERTNKVARVKWQRCASNGASEEVAFVYSKNNGFYSDTSVLFSRTTVPAVTWTSRRSSHDQSVLLTWWRWHWSQQVWRPSVDFLWTSNPLS